MNIAICDPDPLFRRNLGTMLEQYCQEHTIDAALYFFETGQALLDVSLSFSLLLLEYRLPDMTGSAAVQALRAQSSTPCEVIFVTDSPVHAFEAFSIQAAGYLLKPLFYRDLDPVLHRCMSRFWDCTRSLEIICNRIAVRLPILAIQYAEVQKNLTILHTGSHFYPAYLAMDELERRLPQDAFLRCHRSYLVHLRWVDRVEKSNFILQNGTQIPIRIREKIAVKQAYQDYLFHREQQALWQGAPSAAPKRQSGKKNAPVSDETGAPHAQGLA